MHLDRLRIEVRHVVTYEGIPVGNRFNFGPGKRGLGFPPACGSQFATLGFDSPEAAQKALADLKAYIADVKAKEAKARAGSSRYWPPAKAA